MGHPSNPVFSDTPTFEKKGGYQEFRSDVLSAEDWLGHRFAVGDRVMYCIGAGRGQMMAIGEVKKIRARQWDRLVSWEWRDGTRINTAYEKVWEIEVQVITEKTSGSWDNKARTRPAWVNSMNITAIESVSL